MLASALARLGTASFSLQMGHFRLNGAAQESNLPSLGLPDLTGFEDALYLAQPRRLQPMWASPRARQLASISSTLRTLRAAA